jgi:hypothetical protein
MRSLMICTAHPIQGFGGESLRERDHLGDPGLGGRIILRWIFRKLNVRA